jgi:hypothetical protein
MNRRRPSEDRIVRRTGTRLAGVARTVLSLAGVAAVTGTVGWGAVRGWYWLRHSDVFAIHDVRVTGTHRTSPEELNPVGGLAVGTNIFSVDLAAATRAMEEVPWVRHVRIARDLPDVVRVDVQEYEPAAAVQADGLLAVSRDGVVIRGASSVERLGLQVLTGFDREALESGGEQQALLLALAILDGYREHKMNDRAPLDGLHVDWSSGEPTWTAFLGDEAVTVTLGVIAQSDLKKTLPDALERLRRVWDDIERRGARPRRIDVGNRQRPEWVAARLE